MMDIPAMGRERLRFNACIILGILVFQTFQCETIPVFFAHALNLSVSLRSPGTEWWGNKRRSGSNSFNAEDRFSNHRPENMI